MDPPQTGVHTFWRHTDKEYRCPTCNLKGIYRKSAITKKLFGDTQVHLYRCIQTHKWVVIEGDGNVESRLID